MSGRKKIKNRELLLSRKINIRVSEQTVKILNWLAANSGWRHIGSVVRVLLMGKAITILYKDPAVTATLPDYQNVRAEIHQLGIIINQLTQSFHRAETSREKLHFAMEVAEEYAKVGEKVDQLITMVSKLEVAPSKGKKRMTLDQYFKEYGIEL
jgi:hypothetical protein